MTSVGSSSALIDIGTSLSITVETSITVTRNTRESGGTFSISIATTIEGQSTQTVIDGTTSLSISKPTQSSVTNTGIGTGIVGTIGIWIAREGTGSTFIDICTGFTITSISSSAFTGNTREGRSTVRIIITATEGSIKLSTMIDGRASLAVSLKKLFTGTRIRTRIVYTIGIGIASEHIEGTLINISTRVT